MPERGKLGHVIGCSCVINGANHVSAASFDGAWVGNPANAIKPCPDIRGLVTCSAPVKLKDVVWSFMEHRSG